jgi:PAS domain S-box-containing protein
LGHALAESERGNRRLQELLNQRAIFTALIENSSDFIGIADAQGTPLYLNPAGRRMVGLASDFIVSATQITDYYPPELRTFTTDVILKGMQERGHWEGETRLRHWQTERAIPVSDRHFMIRDPETGRLLGMGTITRDISDIQRVRDEISTLAEAGAILAATLDHEDILTRLVQLAVRNFADLCSVDVFEDGGELRRLQVVSRDPSLEWACEILRAAPPDRARPHEVWSILQTQRPMLMESLSPEMADSFAQDNPERLRAIRAIGPQSAIIVPLLAQGRVIGLLAFVSSSPSHRYDAQDVRLAEALALRASFAIQNARLYRAAQRALQARDEVLGIVAHDLRNPLNSIVLQADILKAMRPELPVGSPEPISAIHRAAVRMGRLIQDLLDITRVEAGRLGMEPTTLSAAQLMQDIAEVHRPTFASASIELRLEIAPELPPVWADRERLMQVFDNLISNALQFTTAGGVVTIGARKEEGSRAVRFWVADTGSGIAAEELPHLFDRFWQARHNGRHGAGLGLAIVKGIVEAEGGRVWVESTPGQGTRFFFTVPTPSPPAQEPPLPS